MERVRRGKGEDQERGGESMCEIEREREGDLVNQSGSRRKVDPPMAERREH